MMFLFTDKPRLPPCSLIISLISCLKNHWVTWKFVMTFESYNFILPFLSLIIFRVSSVSDTCANVLMIFNDSDFSVSRQPKATYSCLMYWVEGMTNTSMSLYIQSECNTHTNTHILTLLLHHESVIFKESFKHHFYDVNLTSIYR